MYPWSASQGPIKGNKLWLLAYLDFGDDTRGNVSTNNTSNPSNNRPISILQVHVYFI